MEYCSTNFRRPAISLLIFTFSAVLFSGCGPSGKTPDASKQATISGKVTLDGSKAVPLDTSIVFYNSDDNAMVSGKVDAIGNYAVKAADKSVGIPAGRYQVMVRPYEPPAPKMGTPEYTKMMTAGGPAKKDGSNGAIPAKFLAFDTSKIVLEIQPGKNTIDLDLSKL